MLGLAGLEQFTVKLSPLVVVTSAIVTVIFPVVAPVGTVVVILVAVTAFTVATMPLNFTMLLTVVLKLMPWITTLVPTEAEAGSKEVMIGSVAATGLFLTTVIWFP